MRYVTREELVAAMERVSQGLREEIRFSSPKFNLENWSPNCDDISKTFAAMFAHWINFQSNEVKLWLAERYIWCARELQGSALESHKFLWFPHFLTLACCPCTTLNIFLFLSWQGNKGYQLVKGYMLWRLNAEVKCIALWIATRFDVIEVCVDTMHCNPEFVQVWGSISSPEHWVEQRKGKQRPTRGKINFWIYGLKLNIHAHILIQYYWTPLYLHLECGQKLSRLQSHWFMHGGAWCENWEQTKRRSVFSPRPRLPPPNIQSTHPVHHH